MKNITLNMGSIIFYLDKMISDRFYRLLRGKFFILCTICMIINVACTVSDKTESPKAIKHKKINDTWVTGIKGLWVEDPNK